MSGAGAGGVDPGAVTEADGAVGGDGPPGGGGAARTAPGTRGVVRTGIAGGARKAAGAEEAARRKSAAGADDAAGAPEVVTAENAAAAQDAARVGEEASAEVIDRVLLTRVVEPGDEVAGRWVRERGAGEVVWRLRAGGPPLPGASGERWAGMLARAERARPEHDLAAARQAGVRFVPPGAAEWPRQLDDLGDARPLGLWVRGRPSLRLWALRSVAVVGARACTEYGAHVATGLAAGLAERGWVVVSGGAYGVDGAAHRGALGAGGATVAVLACGIDRPYPRGHAELIGRIGQQGLVVGELPPGEHPTRSRFVLRNRVIAALTRGTVVVEAACRSGSLVTARAARRLGRHTMGVPGPVTSGLSAGVHDLLRADAVLVTDAAEVVELVGDMGELAPERRGPVLPRDLLEPGARRVLDALPGDRAAGPREIARGAQTTDDDALARLYELRSLGYVERHDGGWKLTRHAVNSVRPGREPC